MTVLHSSTPTFLSIMKICNLLIQVTLSSKSVVTNFTFEWFISFMKRKQHSDSSHPFEQIFILKLHIWMAYFIHEQMQHVFSSHSFEQICSHKLHSWIAYLLHEQIQHGFSIHPFEQICCHKLYSWIAYFPYEQMQLLRPRTTDSRWRLFHQNPKHWPWSDKLGR